mmetsp:Transcript_66686/g.131474  ORF Transcript_66686/g.131474 Transcript_66686/m.131474 type:complete len:124 (+) Transcript_66686:74-445(+)
MGPIKDSIDESKVTIMGACCCNYNGFDCENSPIGCAENNTCCCIHCECCCKSDAELLRCICCNIGCETVTTCIKSEAQICCMTGACAFPPDNEVPCIIATCCITCYPAMGPCLKLGDIRDGQD